MRGYSCCLQEQHILKEMLHTVQHFMRAHKREDFSHAGQEENITVFMRLVLHVFQKCLRRCDLLKLLEKVFLPALFFQPVHGFQDALVLQEPQENLVEVAFLDVGTGVPLSAFSRETKSLTINSSAGS